MLQAIIPAYRASLKEFGGRLSESPAGFETSTCSEAHLCSSASSRVFSSCNWCFKSMFACANSVTKLAHGTLAAGIESVPAMLDAKAVLGTKPNLITVKKAGLWRLLPGADHQPWLTAVGMKFACRYFRRASSICIRSTDTQVVIQLSTCGCLDGFQIRSFAGTFIETWPDHNALFLNKPQLCEVVSTLDITQHLLCHNVALLL